MTKHVTDINVGKMTIEEAIRELTVFELYQEEGVETYIPFNFLGALRMATNAQPFQQGLVRCKDCRHYNEAEFGWCEIHSYFNEREERWTWFFPHEHCPMAERRDGE